MPSPGSPLLTRSAAAPFLFLDHDMVEFLIAPVKVLDLESTRELIDFRVAEDLPVDVGGDRNARLADESSKQSPHGAEVLHVDGAELGQTVAVVSMQVVLALLVGVG